MFTYEFKTCITREKELYYFVERRSNDQQIFSKEVEFPEKDFPVLKIGSRMVVPKEKFIAWVGQNTKGGGI